MAAKTAYRRWRREVHDILEVGGVAHPAGRVVNAFIVLLIVLNAVAFAAETVNDLAVRYATAFAALNVFTVIIFTVEYILRMWSAVDIPTLSRLTPWRARLHFALRPIMVIDFLAFAPWYLQWLFPIDLRILRVLRLFRLLKLVRYSPALQTLGRVIADENRALFGALLIMVILLFFASTGMYMLEREAQPDKFGSIPAAAWWALSTLTTIGYGDAVPITPWGKLLGGVVMLLGVGMFALPIAILATGFNQEANRHQFVVTWSMVARVPLFATLDEAEVAEIAKLLYSRTYMPGVPMVRAGDPGDGLYLLASGEAAVELGAGKRAILKEGDFFGEMALLANRRRKYDVIAKTRCRVYVLDNQAFARLSRRHPEILHRVRKVAAARRENDTTKLARTKPAKSRAASSRKPEPTDL
jgi:voltage-gated potassium channel